jgi:hypothetical protein
MYTLYKTTSINEPFREEKFATIEEAVEEAGYLLEMGYIVQILED